MNITKDILHLLLSHLPAKDALALRATCKRLNCMTAHSQLYWFYQYKARYGRRGSKYAPDNEFSIIAGRKLVHVRPVTKRCILSIFVCVEIFEELKKIVPGLEVEYEKLMHLDHGYSAYYSSAYNRRNLFIKYFQAAMTLESVQSQCRLPHHVEAVFSETPKIGLQTKEYVNDDGLYMYQFLYMCYDEMRAKLNRMTIPDPNTVSIIQNQIEALNAKIKTLEHVKWVHLNYEKLKEDMSASPFFRKRNQMKLYHKRPEVEKCLGIEPLIVKKPKKSKKSIKSEK